jgi:hypothetical protein
LAQVKHHLPLAVDDGEGQGQLLDADLPTAETCALALAALAPVSLPLERSCLLLLSYQWASAPQQSRLVELLLDALAARMVGPWTPCGSSGLLLLAAARHCCSVVGACAAPWLSLPCSWVPIRHACLSSGLSRRPCPPPPPLQGYPARRQLLLFHAPWLAWRLLGPRSPWGPAELVRSQALLHGSSARRDRAAFLGAWSPALLPALAQLDDVEGVGLVAGAMGLAPAKLLAQHYRQVIAAFYPLAQVGRRSSWWQPPWLRRGAATGLLHERGGGGAADCPPDGLQLLAASEARRLP